MNAAGRVPMMIAVCVVLAALCEAPPVTPSRLNSRPLRTSTRAAGVGHRHHGPALDERLRNLGVVQRAGRGGAVGDFDNDGFEDIYVTDSLRGKPNVLYHNNGDFTFTDVAAQAGIANLNDDKNFSTMALFFDCDNDGYKDLFVVRFGQSMIFRNRGDGTFEDVTALSEIPHPRNSVAAVAFDYDRDGKLDLFVGSYFPTSI